MRSLVMLLPLTLCLTGPGLAADSPSEPATSANPTLSVIARAPEFSLRDLSGKPVRLSDYHGRVVLLAFVFTTCPGVCPLISKQMSALQESLKHAAGSGAAAKSRKTAQKQKKIYKKAA